MRRRHIIAIGHMRGNGDREIVENVASLSKRYGNGTYKGAKCSYHPVHLDVPFGKATERAPTDKQRDELDDVVANIVKDGGDVGLYILCHGSADSMEPTPEMAAKEVLNLIRRGVCPDKINLGACNSAGGLKIKKSNSGTKTTAVNQDAFQGSSAHRFCNALLTLVGKEEGINLPNNLKVCAYNVSVTTFDREAETWKGSEKVEGYFKKWPNTVEDTKNAEEGHNVSFDYGWGGKIKNASPMRPKAITGGNVQDTLEMLLTHRYKEAQGNAWQETKGQFGAVLNDYETYEAAKLAGELSEGIETHYRRGEVKQLRGVCALDNPEVAMAMTQYIKDKIVLCYEPNQKTFRVGSLSEYSDTVEIKGLITTVETIGLGSASPNIALHFHPDAGAPDTQAGAQVVDNTNFLE